MARVGVTGHRWLTATPELIHGVDAALARIAHAFSDTPTTVISPLAEGADSLVVQRAFVRGTCRLVVPLLMPVTDYLQTFTSDDSRNEFRRLLSRADEIVPMRAAPTDDDAYQAVGHWVLDHADALLVIWDGQPARGTGGTAEIVEAARARGLPMAWVHAAGETSTQRQSAGPGSIIGTVSYERF